MRCPPLSEALIAEPRETQRHWVVRLGPVASRLVPSLADLCRGWTQPRWLERLGPAGLAIAPTLAACQDPVQDPIVRSAAAEVLAEILKSDGGDLRWRDPREIEPGGRANPPPRARRPRTIDRGDRLPARRARRANRRSSGRGPQGRVGRPPAAAGIALAELGRPDDLWPLLRHSPDPASDPC